MEPQDWWLVMKEKEDKMKEESDCVPPHGDNVLWSEV